MSSTNKDKQNTKYYWEEDFEKNFKIKPDNNEKKFRLIIGQAPYKQLVGHIPLRVDVASKGFYSFAGIKQVAFLVNKWIKMQDSFEMIFNMLAGDRSRALRILTYLIEQGINASEFGEYLSKNYNLMMVNSKDHQGESQISSINKLINEMKIEREMKVNIMIVGKNSIIKKIEGCNCCEVMHPSSKNLNFGRYSQYYDTWYKFDNSAMNAKFGLPKPSWDDFHVLKEY